MTVFPVKHRTSRRERTCDWCGKRIKRGERYKIAAGTAEVHKFDRVTERHSLRWVRSVLAYVYHQTCPPGSGVA